MKREARLLVLLLLCAAALLWAIPFAWMAVASLRPNQAGALDLASLLPARPVRPGATSPTPGREGHFPLWYLNTDAAVRRHPGGAVRHRSASPATPSPGCASAAATLLFHAFLLQLMLVPPILIVPNMTTLVALHLYDTLAGVMAPYFASAFGVFLMRQTFRTIPRDYEEAALVDGASAADHHLPRAAAAGAARAWPPSPSSRSPRTGTSSCGR